VSYLEKERILPRTPDIDVAVAGTPPALDAVDGSDRHRAFIDGIEICAERFPRDEEKRVSCFAEVVSATIGRRPSKRTGTAIPADSAESRRRGSAHAHAALRAKRAAKKAAAAAEAAASTAR
jgi:hypothetical protein